MAAARAVWAKVFELNGESYDGEASRCPGDGKCQIWDATEGRPREEREASCIDCRICSGPPSDDPEDETGDDPAIDDLVAEIEDIILYQDAGSPTDWTQYPPEWLWLAGQWRKAEKTVATIKTEKLIRIQTHGTPG